MVLLMTVGPGRIGKLGHAKARPYLSMSAILQFLGVF